MALSRKWTLWVAAALTVAACGGGLSQGVSGTDGGDDGGAPDVTTASSGSSGSSGGFGGSSSSSGGGSSSGSGSGGTSSSSSGGTPVDAGLFFGDGSFWVDGGPYPDLDAGPDVASDAPTPDAATPCGALAVCCPTLSGGSQALCSSVAAGGDPANCQTELDQLESQGNCLGVTILASNVQVPADRMVSDGTILFWTTQSAPGLLAVPVQGGTVTTLLSAQAGGFLVVDDVNVYVLEGASLVRIPRSGAQPTLMNNGSAQVVNATALAGTAYWLETEPYDAGQSAVQSAPLLGGGVVPIAPYVPQGATLNEIGVTTSMVFLFGPLVDLPMGGGNPSPVAGMPNCNSLTSDTAAVYCTGSSSNLSIASNGTMTTLGQTVGSSYIVYDDTYVYWADATTVGTIKKAPKSGGGATILARDTSPTAIAVDSTSVYWSDQQGYIKKIPK